ncbi:hypothetical protein [Halobaculum lipolyticum]|uniref:Uncharacterized protein n=1 Tax=Halobaculum lipolyticum TaxID=3032001 RepID=A0ABD5WAC6_9EURY|nr:hypothetical protein [Halobaculum sp. DT31]
MATDSSFDGRTLVGVSNDDAGDVGTETRVRFEQTGDRIHAEDAGSDVVECNLLGTVDGTRWDVRSTRIDATGETALGHSVGEVSGLADGRRSVGDE